MVLNRATLTGTTLLDANLSRADLSGVMFERADLQRANLAGADFTGASLLRSVFSGAFMLETNLSEITVVGVKFNQARMAKARMVEASVNDSTFAQLSAAEACFHQSRFYDVDFSEALLEGSQLLPLKAATCSLRGNRRGGRLLRRSENRPLPKFDRGRAGGIEILREPKLVQCSFRNALICGPAIFAKRASAAAIFRSVSSPAHGSAARSSPWPIFRGADLKGARELTAEQLGQAMTDESTVLPNGRRGPYLRKSGAVKPNAILASARRRPVFTWEALFY